MEGKNIRDLLNKIIWDPREDKQGYNITYKDRFAGEVDISFSQILEVDKKGMIVLGDTYIPFHRIKQVKKENEVVWGK